MERASDSSLRKSALDRDCRSYLSSHPVVGELLQDFTTAVLNEKPEDVQQFARNYFSQYQTKPNENSGNKPTNSK
jgi:hypothetical protein